MAPEDWPPFLPPEALLRLEGDLRREAGRQRFTAVMGLLLEPISHPLLSELADWACNEPGTLHTSQISLLRNGKTRMLGTKCVDALGRINQAVWVVQQRPELLPRLGTAPLSERLRRRIRQSDSSPFKAEVASAAAAGSPLRGSLGVGKGLLSGSAGVGGIRHQGWSGGAGRRAAPQPETDAPGLVPGIHTNEPQR